MAHNESQKKSPEYKKFAAPRIIGGIAIAIIILWALTIFFGSWDQPASQDVSEKAHDSDETTVASINDHDVEKTTTGHDTEKAVSEKEHGTEGTDATGNGSKDHEVAKETDHADSPGTTKSDETEAHGTTIAKTHDTGDREKTGDSHESTQSTHPADTPDASETASQSKVHEEPAKTVVHPAPSDSHSTESRSATAGHPLPDTVHAPSHKPKPKGVAFVEAAIAPLLYELEERWWGWRANDIINVTDNVKNFQMGVLEVTRRTTVALAERISRTGTTDAFDENLEQAMNWFMVKASSYWFPSAESKYRDGLEELEHYLEKLKKGRATFYTRTDNLIPLLASFEDLLGSCDENLVKRSNEDGTPVSFFAVDNYFYYTQGVANSMATVLEAIHHDFLLTLESRNGTELLHHAIISCQRAAELEPWIVLDSSLSSIFANHRANMAAPISHARFYIGQLIKTLST